MAVDLVIAPPVTDAPNAESDSTGLSRQTPSSGALVALAGDAMWQSETRYHAQPCGAQSSWRLAPPTVL